jgi:hypothetical protein
MSDSEASVGVYVASYNTAAATELCVRSMHRYAGRPFSLTVGDGGSHDDSPAMLRSLASDGWLELESAPGGRAHAEWLDHWFATCPYRYAVFSDSDVEYLEDRWLDALVTTAQRSAAALVATRIQARDWPEYVHPITGKAARLAPRPEPWLMLIDVAQARDRVTAGFAYAEEQSDQGLVAYDIGAAFFASLQSVGLEFVEMPAAYQASYRHFGGMSWQRPGDRQLAAGRRARQVVKALRIRSALRAARRWPRLPA